MVSYKPFLANEKQKGCKMEIAAKGPSMLLSGLIGAVLCITAMSHAATTQPSTTPVLDGPFARGELLASDDFDRGLDAWSCELEKGGAVRAHDGAMEIDVPGGCTVWWKQRLDGPLLIEYQATVVKAGGPNDRVSDLNCFWMARDSRSPDDLFATHRTGKFSDYNPLKCYYVGLGGNTNTTTRFRRYVGGSKQRPLLPQNDLRGEADMIVANATQTVRLVAAGSLIQYYRDGRKLFEMNDPEPYTSGWFGIRTTQNHMLVRHFKVYRLVAK